jgi:anti-anti-sigma factor
MEIEFRESGNVLILDLIGDLRTVEDYDSFKTAVDSALQKNNHTVLLNFREVGFINSAGIGRLILFAKALNDRGGELVVANLSEPLRELFTFTRLDTKIPIFDTEEEALNRFAP